MGLMDKLMGGTGTRSTDEYVELDLDDFETEVESDASGMQVRIASIGGQQDVIAIKDAIYDGDLVIADITRHTTSDRTMEHITDELKQVAREVGGDIVQKDDDQLIITPTDVTISRTKL
ncbi:cell division protein SepF [Halomarina ordinaria]|uniref:Cell division protein SepF n=1 Tax=Halomarina ordinaria TaxID=3033939 RepID=A0ABD5U7T3_9EURY|nr:cell division protein SepF [Halomarina sp. PSRA2]